MISKKSFILIQSTFPQKDLAEKCAHSLIQKELAFCVQIIPQIKSFYYWDNKVQSDEEVLLFIKTISYFKKNCTQEILASHPYEIAEVISSPIELINKAYFQWALKATAKD